MGPRDGTVQAGPEHPSETPQMHQFHKDGLRHHFWVGSRKQQRQPVKPKLFVSRVH